MSCIPEANAEGKAVIQETPQIPQTEEPEEEVSLPAPQRYMPRQSGDFTATRTFPPAGPRIQHKKPGSASVPGTSPSASPTLPKQASSPPAPEPPTEPALSTLAINDTHDHEILDDEQGGQYQTTLSNIIRLPWHFRPD